MKKLTANKKELINLWKEHCSGADVDTVLENIGCHDGQMHSIKINDEISLSLFSSEIKVIFSQQIEYLSEKLSKKENEELKASFIEAEETIERLRRDAITSAGIKALERLLDK